MSKPKESHNGNCTKNARIKIDYSGIKPKVHFSYPDKKHQVNGSMFVYICSAWLLILLIGFYGYGIGYNLINGDGVPEDYDKCVSHYENRFIQEKEDMMETLCILEKSSLITQIRGSAPNNLIVFLYPLFLLMVCFIPPILIYWPFKKKWNSLYPKFQAWTAKKKLSIFNPEDVKYDGKDYYVEVPLFNNILLNYKATKGFSKYLKFFEIREHNFKYIVVGRFKGKKGKKNKRRRQLNEWIWYAKFYFSKKPETGKIEVTYK